MPSISDDPPEYVIAEAIADAINAATFTGPITALSAVVDEIAEPENLDNPANTTPHVFVIPAPSSTSPWQKPAAGISTRSSCS